MCCGGVVLLSDCDGDGVFCIDFDAELLLLGQRPRLHLLGSFRGHGRREKKGEATIAVVEMELTPSPAGGGKEQREDARGQRRLSIDRTAVSSALHELCLPQVTTVSDVRSSPLTSSKRCDVSDRACDVLMRRAERAEQQNRTNELH